MPTRLPIANRAGCIDSPCRPPSQWLWISDDLLATTFNHFAHRHRRHGSNVPGPLEAQRRATKRKNTRLAHGGTGTAPLDPSVLLGMKQQDDWWTKPPTPPVQQRPPLLPSWLALVLDPLAQQSPTSPSIVDVQSADPYSATTSSAQEKEALVKRIRQCTKLKTIRQVISNAGATVREHPELAETAFRQVLSSYWMDASTTKTALQEFLNDPMLNPPGSANSLVLLQELCDKGVTRKTWDTIMFPAIQDAVRLGLVGVEVIQEIITMLPKVHESCGLDTIKDGQKIVADYHRLLTSIDECGILSLKDLRHDYLTRWYSQMSTEVMSDGMIGLLWRLRDYSRKQHLDVITDLVVARLRYSVQAETPAAEKFKAWITSLPQELRGSAILRTSQNLVCQAMSGKITTTEIDHWHQIVSHMNQSCCSHVVIDGATMSTALTHYEGLTARQNFLVLTWTITHLAMSKEQVIPMLNPSKFQQIFDELFSMTDQQQGGMLGEVLMTLHTLPLPAKTEMHWFLKLLSQKKLITVSEARPLKEELNLLLAGDVSRLNDERVYHWTKLNHPDVLTDVAHAASMDLATFSNLAQNLIMKNKTMFKIVRRILKHDLSMKLALPLWPSHVAFLKEEYGREFDSVPSNVADMVHHLAISFAMSPVISSRSAFRNVYKLYIYLHRYRGPIYPSMSRALWHAGVARYGNEGAPSAQLRWCLSKVREIEGAEEADMLLWSAGFRRMRIQQMENSQGFTPFHESSLSRQQHPIPTKIILQDPGEGRRVLGKAYREAYLQAARIRTTATRNQALRRVTSRESSTSS